VDGKKSGDEEKIDKRSHRKGSGDEGTNGHESKETLRGKKKKY